MAKLLAHRRAGADHAARAAALDAGRGARTCSGVVELGLIVGFAWLGAAAVRRRLVPELDGVPAHLATTVIALAMLLWVAELLGTLRLVRGRAVSRCRGGCGVGALAAGGGPAGGPSGLLGFSPGESAAVRERGPGEKQDAAAPEGRPHRPSPAALAALAIAAVAVVQFAAGGEAEAVDGDDRVRFDLVPRAVRGWVLSERRHVGVALHRAAVPGLVLPGEFGSASTGSGCWPSTGTSCRRC